MQEQYIELFKSDFNNYSIIPKRFKTQSMSLIYAISHQFDELKMGKIYIRHDDLNFRILFYHLQSMQKNNENTVWKLLDCVEVTIEFFEFHLICTELFNINQKRIKYVLVLRDFNLKNIFSFNSKENIFFELGFSHKKITSDEECFICCEKNVDIELSCNHQLCLNCASKIDICPFCRREIQLCK